MHGAQTEFALSKNVEGKNIQGYSLDYLNKAQ